MKIYLILGFVLLFSCSKDKSPKKKLSSSELLLSYHNCNNENEKLKQNNYTICYDSLITESRCPSDVVCVWQGYAQVALTLKLTNQNISFKLCTTTLNNGVQNLITDTTINGLKIKLVDVLPYPNTAIPFNINDSKVKLELTN